jgi:hypothetical protein
MTNSNMNIEQQIDILLKRQLWNPPPNSGGVVPDYLQQGYARESIAGWLGDTSDPAVPVVAALIRAAMTDEEENVRERALKSLRSFAEKGYVSNADGAAILWAATYDPSSRVRCTALEGMWALDESLGKECAMRLSGDADWLVAETARNIVNAE